jgi:hypothetical protein
MFNIGAYLSRTRRGLARPGSSIDLFSIWIIVLLAFGCLRRGAQISFG